ncbi:hypothetical protein UPYG_G00178640 [Umbra pygmaea]|uniref:Matrin-type domain-containing protein n=1 Tax=Umbra pygmaea TaxID=75934 RepID=A0ABD0WV02_UMBPY
MFGHQQQQLQQQLQQNQGLWQLQQHLQQRQQLHKHQVPRHNQINRPVGSPLSLCPFPQSSPVTPNRMLQEALLIQQHMQANMRSLAVGGGLPLTFLAKGTRQSILGPAPVPRVQFSPSGPYRSHAHFQNMDLRVTKRDYEQTGSVSGSLGSGGTICPAEGADKPTNTKMGEAKSDKQLFAPSQEVPETKKQKTNGSEEHVNVIIGQDAVQMSEDKRPLDMSNTADIAEIEYRDGCPAMLFSEECCKESQTADQVLGVGTSLKVTIQQSSESRAFSTGLEDPGTSCGSQGHGQDTDPDQGPAVDSHYCYICSVSCHNQQNFQNHMNGEGHQQRMLEIQHLSNACLINLLPRVGESPHATRTHCLALPHCRGEKTGGVQRWCATCQTHFSGQLIEHRRTTQHKLSKQFSRPFCTVCKRHFRTPRKFVEHMKSQEHKRQVEELQEEGPEVLEELITVDAVGCFEGEDDFEEETHEDEDTREGQPGQREVTLEDIREHEEFDSETEYGSSFVVPVAGFLCRLCHKFFYFESTARHFHCKSLMHFQNLRKYKALKSQKSSVMEYTGNTCSQMSQDSPAPSEASNDKGDITKECRNTSKMDGNETSPCCIPTTIVQTHPIIANMEELNNIFTDTQQDTVRLDDSVMVSTGEGSNSKTNSNSGCENLLKPAPCRSSPNPQESLCESERTDGAGGRPSLILPSVQQDTPNETPEDNCLERKQGGVRKVRGHIEENTLEKKIHRNNTLKNLKDAGV